VDGLFVAVLTCRMPGVVAAANTDLRDFVGPSLPSAGGSVSPELVTGIGKGGGVGISEVGVQLT
jgi:hypothetical protein